MQGITKCLVKHLRLNFADQNNTLLTKEDKGGPGNHTKAYKVNYIRHHTPSTQVLYGTVLKTGWFDYIVFLFSLSPPSHANSSKFPSSFTTFSKFWCFSFQLQASHQATNVCAMRAHLLWELHLNIEKQLRIRGVPCV